MPNTCKMRLLLFTRKYHLQAIVRFFFSFAQNMPPLCASPVSSHDDFTPPQVKENETEEERRARLEKEALDADENERRRQVRSPGAGSSCTATNAHRSAHARLLVCERTCVAYMWHLCVCVRACAHACLHLCVCVCVCVRACVRACVRRACVRVRA